MVGQIRRLVQRALLVVVGAVIVLGALDSGSVALTQMQLPERVRTAGHAATEVSAQGKVNRQTAVSAWKAAERSAEQQGFTISTTDFTIYPDGRVSLTGTRAAPTLLLHRVDALRHLARVSDTETVKPLPYSSAPQPTRRTR